MDDKQCQHDEKVRELELEFRKLGAEVITFKEYSTCEGCGEIDLIATWDYGQEFYEIKCNHRKFNKAQEQYEKYLKTHNLTREDLPGYFVCCDRKDRRRL